MSEIDPLDPLLPAFALQHDFRERFFHALQEIEEVIASDAPDADRLARVGEIASEALDHQSIKAWLEANRPLPWIDEVLGDESRQLTQRVLDSLAAEITL
jgi:hypothetical protein